jgi:membrane-associated protease RseP (regulator of RpoE activity)
MNKFDDQFSGTNYQQPALINFANKIRTNRPLRHVILFLLTILTTYMAHGILYALSIISILLAHEMGHYLMCRKYGIPATLPFFIPFPFPQFNPFGTLGAVIKMQGRIPHRRALFDIGAAGPLAGLAVTIPVLVIGLKNTQFVPLQAIQPGTLFLGESFLFKQLSQWIMGPTPPGYDAMLHPMAFAGWAGLFVTALNLLPIGQLDGGHILYSIFGYRSEPIYKFAMAAFIIVCAIWYPGWMLLIILLLWVGYRHPAPENDFIPLDRKRKALGYVTFVIFLISFIPIPFHILTN